MVGRTVFHLTVTGGVPGRIGHDWLSHVVWKCTLIAEQMTLFHCRHMSAREMLGRLTSDAVFGSNQVRAVRVSVIPHVRQRGRR